MAVLYVLIFGPEWEDLEYFVAEGHALRRLQSLSETAFVEKYVCEDGCVFKKEGVYRKTSSGEVAYDGKPLVLRVRRGYDHDTDEDSD